MAFPQRKRTPSFSSSVLDSIYRSIDESDGLQSDGNNENDSSASPNKEDDKLTTLRRVIMDDEHWLYPRSSTTNSSETSAFSSSESELYRAKRRSSKLVDQNDDRLCSKSDDDKKLKQVKMLEEIKRPKQPLSPGARLTSFLNSIFQSNAKKVKLCSVSKTTEVKSSSSRSCFSRTKCKTDNNNNNSCNNLKRSVRFYPVRVIVDGDCRDYVHKNITREKKPIPEFTAKKRVMSLKEEIKTTIHQTELTCITRKKGLKNCVTSYRDEGDQEEEDDVWSYSSSDLFELDNHRIGMGRYIKELPVYETTNFKTNQAIARGLLL